MITFEYRFDVLPGKTKDYQKYLARAGKDIWLKFPGVRSVRIYQSMLGGSSPQRVVQVELDNLHPWNGSSQAPTSGRRRRCSTGS